MVRSFYTESGVRQRATTSTDARNNTVLSWSAPATSTITGVRLQPLKAEEIRPGRTGQLITHRLLAPTGSDILADDRWVQGGVTFEVDGDGLNQSSPSGSAAHMQVFLRQVKG
jgi:hypothetical protein